MAWFRRLLAATLGIALAGCAAGNGMDPDLERANAALKAEAQRKNN